MGQLHDRRFPGETPGYREARNALLRAELALRDQSETVARLRRELPPGGELAKDYVFEELCAKSGAIRQIPFSALFEDGKVTLIVYNFMFGPQAEKPCPMCTSIVDGYVGNAATVQRRANFAIIAKAPAARLREWADSRHWKNLRMLSSEKNDFKTDYHAQFDSEHGNQHPLLMVFRKERDAIRLFWASELLFIETDGQSRHADGAWPLWNLLDLTPEGRGEDFYPQYER